MANIEHVRQWLAAGPAAPAQKGVDVGVGAGAGVHLLAPGLAVLSPRPLDQPQLRRIAEVTAAVETWLRGELGLGDFPAVLVHVDPGHPLVPQAHLHPDRRAHRVTLSHADIKTDHLVHELVHALSDLRDEWASELLAYRAGFTGLGVLPSAHDAALAGYRISLEDIVREGGDWSRLLAVRAPGTDPGLLYDPGNPFAGFHFLWLYQVLQARCTQRARRDYFTQVDAAPDEAAREALFRACFGLSRVELASLASAALSPESAGQDLPDPIGLERSLLAIRDRWWADVFDLVYLRTAFARQQHAHRPGSNQRGLELLYLDYRMYRAQRSRGVKNQAAQRFLLRHSLQQLRHTPTSTGALVLRYFLLTDHALDQYQGRMALLPVVDGPLADSLMETVRRLDREPEDPLLARLTQGHFHLFYPARLGADPAVGLRLLETVRAEAPACEEAYLHLASFFARRGDGAALASTIRSYREQVAVGPGPDLLEQMTTADRGTAAGLQQERS